MREMNTANEIQVRRETASKDEQVNWLTFRRTSAIWADQIGMSARQRGEVMGNSAEVNAMIYTQVMDHPLRLAVERVSSELFTERSKLFTPVRMLN